MIISNCPRCQEGFRVPTGTMPDNAYAMCPWCHETYPLAEVLDRLPPPLQILTAEGDPIIVMEPAGSSTAVADAGSLDHLSGQDTSASGGSWDPTALNLAGDTGQDDGSWTAPSSPTAATMNVSPRPNRRKKKGSAIRSMIGVVFGGLLSVPIALSILLAVGRAPDLGFWPFDGEARSPRELFPFFNDADSDDVERPVYQGEVLDTSEFDKAVEDLGDPSQSILDQILAPGPPTNSNETSDDGADRKSENQEERRSDLTSVSQNPSNEPGSGTPNLPPATSTTSADEPPKLPATTGVQEPDDQTRTPATTIAASQSKQGSPSDVSITVPTLVADASLSSETIADVNSAIRSISNLDNSNKADETELLADAYEQMARACSSAHDEPTALVALAKAITMSKALEQIEEAGLTWLEYPQRSSAGIVLIGRPGSSAKNQILTLESGQILTMVGNINLPSVEKVIVLGQITEDAKTIKISHAQALP